MDFLKTLAHDIQEGTHQAAHPQTPENNDQGRNLVDQISNLSIGGSLGNHPPTSNATSARPASGTTPMHTQDGHTKNLTDMLSHEKDFTHGSALKGERISNLSVGGSLGNHPPTSSAAAHGAFDKVAGAFGSGGSYDHATAPRPASDPTVMHKQGGFMKNLTDVLSHEKTSTHGSAQRGENLLAKNSGQIGGEHPSNTALAGGLLGQLSGVLGSHVTNKTESAQGQTGLLGKISGVLDGHKTEPAKPQGLGDKINHMLGGGAAGEQKEDYLDKAVDLFQEHVLHEGKQNNESAIEQAKDKAIANTIRQQYKNVTGKEFFIKEKP